MAPSYTPWLKLWSQAMRAGDPSAVLSVGGGHRTRVRKCVHLVSCAECALVPGVGVRDTLDVNCAGLDCNWGVSGCGQYIQDICKAGGWGAGGGGGAGTVCMSLSQAQAPSPR
jgi:hypothetical protein